ncbi:benzoylformate decarboxylase [Burkholderia pseudomallei]|nr:benzoylformate decarboxylase [Burkholderia pseudomallei]
MTPPDLRADAPARAPYTVRDAVIDLLRRFGIRKVFGNPGSTELPMFRNFPDDFEYVLGLHEAVAVGMADGYAQASGNAAVVNLHSAAGVGNAMGVLFTAYRNKTPLVVTAGQQARSILPFEPFLASVQAAELPKPYVKWSIEPARAEDVPAAIARAYHVAMQEPRGPVFVSIPADDWDRPAEPMPARTVSSEVRPAPEALARLGDALDASERPAFVVGAAVARAGAWDDAVRLAERHRARVYAAPMSGRCSFPEDHPLFAGFLPPIRERIVEQLAGHDFILAFGAPVFTYHIEGFGPHVPAGAALHQLVDDPSVAAWTPVGDAVVGNLRLAARDLAARAAFFPKISLTSAFGTASPTLGGLFKAGTAAWSFAPNIALPIFEGGQNIANLDLAHVQKRIEIANYEKAIQSAFREVSDGLAARGTYDQQIAALERNEHAQQRRYDLSDLRYRNGVDSYLSVLTAQTDLYSAQQQLISARLARWTNLVDLYRALGGGWLERAGETPRPADAPVDYGKAAPAPAAASARTAAVTG